MTRPGAGHQEKPLMPARTVLLCSRCGADGPFSPSTKTGGWCNPCCAAYQRARRKAKAGTETPEQREARLRRSRMKKYGRPERIYRTHATPEDAAEAHRADQRARIARDPEANRAKVAAWQRANRARHNANARRSYYANIEKKREQGRETSRRHRARYPEKVLARNMSRRLDAESCAYVVVLMADPCAYCGGPREHIDHIDAFATGGENHWTNLTAACQSCNRAKGSKSLLAFLAGGTP